MKVICSVIVITLFFITNVLANTPAKKPAKTYTEEEFIKKVNEEVKKKVDDIKNKSISDLTKEILDKEEQLKLKEKERGWK